MRLHIDQATRARDGRMVRGVLIQPDMQKLSQEPTNQPPATQCPVPNQSAQAGASGGLDRG
jgi:hypothetical protein